MAQATVAAGQTGTTNIGRINANFTELYNLLVGKAGGNTIIGGTLTGQGLNLTANAADNTTGTIAVTASTAASSKTTGSLTVAGGLGVAGALFAGATTLDSLVVGTLAGLLKGTAGTVSAATAGTDYTPGSTGVAGGQTVTGGTLTNQDLTLRPNAADTTTGQVIIGSTTTSTSKTTGSLKVLGGMGVAGPSFLADVTCDNATIGALSGALKATAGVVSGSATTADVPASTDKNYVTDAQSTVLGNTSGTNTGDECGLSGRPFRATQTLTAAAAATPVNLVAAGSVTGGKKIYVTDFIVTVNGATPWTDLTATEVYLQDTNGTPVKAATIDKDGLTASAVLGKFTSNVTIQTPMSLGTGLTANKGLDVVADGNFAAGSDLVVTVCGFIA